MSAHNTVAVFVPHAGCRHACAYCDQKRIAGTENADNPREIARLLTEARARLRKDGKTAQIAFFGGSFTAIERDYMLVLLTLANQYLGDVFTSIRISTRPDAIDSEVLALLERFGVRDIELGAQSMDDRVLYANRRGHRSADTRRAARLIKEADFGLGLQMMTGMLGGDLHSDRSTAEELVRLKPDSARIYPTVVLRGTELERLYLGGKYSPQTLEEAVAKCSELLFLFAGNNIPVIRLGLHDGLPLRDGMVAGPHHPAFRELCENRIYLREALSQIGILGIPRGRIALCVRPDCISKMAGQRRANLKELGRLGYPARIIPDETAGYLRLRVKSL